MAFNIVNVVALYGFSLILMILTGNGQQITDEIPQMNEEVSTKPTLTGIPQIDYIWDPNLPRELNGFNLSNYPFYTSVPEKMDFKCDGLHDGFYASVPHRCQVYHHCLFGIRYDFLCANYTAFDQKNFICHFANEVDCDNSPRYYDRNEALYKTTSTTTTTSAPVFIARGRFPQDAPRRRPNGRRRRPIRPVYYDDYYDYDYPEEDVPGGEDLDTKNAMDNSSDQENAQEEEIVSAKPAKPVQQRPRPPGSHRAAFTNENRPPPRIRPPVPNSETKPKKTTKTTTSTTTAEPILEEEVVEDEIAVVPETGTAHEEEEVEIPVRRPVLKRPLQRPIAVNRKQTSNLKAASKTTTTTTTTETITTPEPELPKRPNAALFVRRPPAIGILNRRVPAGNSKPIKETVEDEEQIEEETEEEPIPVATTTAPPVPPRRSQTGKPLRTNARSRPQIEELKTEDKPETQKPTVTRNPGARRGPQIPAEEEIQLVPIKKGSESRQGPQTSQLASEEVLVTRPVLQRPGSRRGPQAQTPVVIEEEDFGEDTEESQQEWTVINLFSNTGPRSS